MLNISKDETKFNDLEEKMWKKKMQEGLNELREQLREIDNKLLKNKNNKELEIWRFRILPKTIQIKAKWRNENSIFARHILRTRIFRAVFTKYSRNGNKRSNRKVI